MYTSHGYYIENSPKDPTVREDEVAGCGGPGVCDHCNLEVDRYNENHPPGSENKIIAAYRVNPDTVADVARITGSRQIKEIDPFDEDKTYVGINLITLTGVVRVSEGDYVVRTQPGWFKKMTAEEYEEVTNATESTPDPSSSSGSQARSRSALRW